MRRPWLDVLKGAAMVLVVANHAIIWPMRAGDVTSAFLYGTAYGTVAAFAAVTGYISGMRPYTTHPIAVIRRRAYQLLLPWAFWAVVYALGPVLWKSLGSSAALPSSFAPIPWARALLLGGGPLWFLPVIFVASAVGVVLDRRTRAWWPAWLMIAAYVLTAVLAWRAGRSPLALGDGTFWAVSPLYVASYWIGLRFARDGIRRWLTIAAWPTIIVTVLLAGFVTLVRAHNGDAGLMWLPYVLGMPGGCVALALCAQVEGAPEGHASRILTRVGEASRGVYVLHPLIVAPVMLGVSVAALPGPLYLAASVIVAVLGVWGATLLTEKVRRLRYGHALV